MAGQKRSARGSLVNFRFLEHTADMGLEVTGATLEDLFLHAAEGLRKMILGEIPAGSPDREERITLAGEDVEELLVTWLNELLFLFETRRFVPLTFGIKRIGREELTALVGGTTFAEGRFRVLREVKAVTYHLLTVEKKNRGWRARLYVDL
ncbi:MAG: archease [Desulfuromonadaceae bacterium]|nr:archease [Desulfuromonadaceae bacterium]